MRQLIIAVVGSSGSGKSTLVDHISSRYGIPVVQSRTERAKRTPDETGHQFVTSKEFDTYKEEDMIAYTVFGGNRYCALVEDLQDKNLYTIDEDGIIYFENKFKDEYDLVKVYVNRSKANRLEAGVLEERITRDEARTILPPTDYDIIIENNGKLEDMFAQFDMFGDDYK